MRHLDADRVVPVGDEWDANADELIATSDVTPVRINDWLDEWHHPSGDRVWWLFQSRIYFTDDERLDASDVKALILEGENKRRLRLEKAHALMAMRDRLDGTAKRQPIPQAMKQSVWVRDNGRCVECASNDNLEFDHIIPLSMGGANTERNLQLLCAACNRRKGATLG